jgi:two-component system chemotaxis sensor kinase CheA
VLLGQFAEELAFSSAGSSAGHAALDAVVRDLEQAGPSDIPASLAAALPRARRVLEDARGKGSFDEGSLSALGAWQEWMSAALLSLRAGLPHDPPPAGWTAPPPRSTPAITPVPVAVSTDEPAIVPNLPADADMLREFHAESVELLNGIEQGVLVLEERPDDQTTINTIFRAFHTFKGSAGFLQLGALRDLSHELESLLDTVRRGERAMTPRIVGLILAGADTLGRYVQEIAAQLGSAAAGQPIVVPTRELVQRLRHALAGKEDDPAPATQAPTPTDAPSKPSVDAEQGYVKVDIAKLDDLINLVGELAIAQSLVVESPAVRQSDDLTLARNLRQLQRVSKALQVGATRLRMVPVRGLFRRMTRLVRDLSQQLGKTVHLKLEGEDTELDRNIVEKLADPLVHMIRNAIDHGVEAPDERVSRGKPATATLRLSAGHRGGGVFIHLQDDGRGLDTRRILERGIARGLVPIDAEPDNAAIHALIFHPGFSTAEQVTEISGRGVGMDIVRGNIEALRGRVEVDSTAGEGTRFSILLPLTLAIIDGLIVAVGAKRYIIPTLAVRQSFRPLPGSVSHVHGRGELVAVRGRQTPVLRLADFLGLESRCQRPEDGILVVVESGDGARALLVDDLVGKQELVIKSLGHALEGQTLMAGGAVLGDGTVGLILDVDTLVRLQ